MSARHVLYYAPQCPNCMRFVSALERTPAREAVHKVDINSLPDNQRKNVPAVPMVCLSTGTTLVGTQAFNWLKQFEGQLELDSFSTGRGLPFSDLADDSGTLMFSTPYGDFEPVP